MDTNYYRDEETNQLIKDNTNLTLKLGGYLASSSMDVNASATTIEHPFTALPTKSPNDLQLFFDMGDSKLQESLLDVSQQELSSYRMQFSAVENLWPSLTPIHGTFLQKLEPVSDFDGYNPENAMDSSFSLGDIFNSTDYDSSSESSDITMSPVCNSDYTRSTPLSLSPDDLDDLYRFAPEMPLQSVDDFWMSDQNIDNAIASSSPIEYSSPCEVSESNFAATEMHTASTITGPSACTEDIGVEVEAPPAAEDFPVSVNYVGTTLAENIISTYKHRIHEPDCITCQHCDKKFDSVHQLVLHLEKENWFQHLKYKCPLHNCPFKLIGFGRKVALRQHIVAKHFDKSNNRIKCKDVFEIKLIKQLVFTCACSKVFCRRDSLQRHIRLIHNGKEPKEQISEIHINQIQSKKTKKK